MMLRAIIVVAVFPCLVSSVGCQGEPAKPDAIVLEPLASLNADQQNQKQQALSARDQMFQALLSELVSAMATEGPAMAIRICKARAPEIATSVSEQNGLRIGRTSFRLRNPDNRPPDWAAHYVDQQIENPIDVALPEDALGVLLPIRLQSTCIVCHGTDQQILPGVKAAIVSNYPEDNATGFSEGDVRGYFWVEVPAVGSPGDR